MKTFFINQNDHYFVINEYVDESKLKGKVFNTRTPYSKHLKQRLKLDKETIKDSEIIIYREFNSLYWTLEHYTAPITGDLVQFLNEFKL